MIFSVFYSAEARHDLRSIYEYIAYKLLAPTAAADQTKRIMKAARTLEQMPMRHKCYEEEPWYSQGLRVLPVDNYLILYLTDEVDYSVNIVRIMYGGREIKNQLSEPLKY